MGKKMASVMDINDGSIHNRHVEQLRFVEASPAINCDQIDVISELMESEIPYSIPSTTLPRQVLDAQNFDDPVSDIYVSGTLMAPRTSVAVSQHSP